MPWWFDVIERKHDIQNPTNPDKIRLLGERLELRPDSTVLDLAAGKAGPAILLAETFGCRVTCVERSEEFVAAARGRVKEAGVAHLVELVQADAAGFHAGDDRYDAALCLGASFIWGGLARTVRALSPAVVGGGSVVVGEPYWRTWPLPDEFRPDEDYDFKPLPETIQRFESAGVELIGLIASSQDDWDRYESLHWQALEEWLAENPTDPDAREFHELGRRERDTYVRWLRDLLGWAIFIGRKR